MKPLALTLTLLAAMVPASALSKTIATVGEVIPLIEATRGGDLDQVSLILAGDTDVFAADPLGRTALHYAAALGNQEIVSVLISYMERLDPVDGDGFPPLMRAAQNGHPGVVRQMLDQGADPSRTNNAGQSALSLARQSGHQTIVELLD